MPILHVRSVPDDLYQRLQDLAQAQNRSISAQVITLLYQALGEEERRQQNRIVLQSIRRRRFAPPASMADSYDLLRDDRER